MNLDLFTESVEVDIVVMFFWISFLIVINLGFTERGFIPNLMQFKALMYINQKLKMLMSIRNFYLK